MNVQQIAEKHGIRLKSFKGSQKTICPQCSHKRLHKEDRCLSVRIDSTGMGWKCFNCNWSGGELDAGRTTYEMVREAAYRPQRGGGYGALLRQARSGWVSNT